MSKRKSEPTPAPAPTLVRQTVRMVRDGVEMEVKPMHVPAREQQGFKVVTERKEG